MTSDITYILMDNESGESMEPMEEVPLIGLGESELTLTINPNYPRESEGLCFYRRWFVCLSVCLFVTTITK